MANKHNSIINVYPETRGVLEHWGSCLLLWVHFASVGMNRVTQPHNGHMADTPVDIRQQPDMWVQPSGEAVPAERGQANTLPGQPMDQEKG